MIKVGIDLVPIERFSFIHTSGGKAFYRRIYTLEEQSIYANSLYGLAACFAGKEAVSKVLGTGLALNEPDRVSCTDVEILLDRPQYVCLHNQAQNMARQLGLINFVLRCFFTSSCVVAVAAGTNRGVPGEELLNCIEQAGAQITSQMSH